MAKGIIERLDEGIVLGDGGYLLELERRGHVQAGPFVPEVSLTNPDALAELHREFVGAGVDVIQTLTFYATEDKMATVGLSGQMENLNRAATRIARQVASEADREVLVAGNLSETWAYDPDDPESHKHVRDLFDRQLAVMGEEGIDFAIAETFLWLGEALIAVEAIKDAGLPSLVTMTFSNEPISYDGHTPGESVKRLAGAGADITGFNCLRSPEHSYKIMTEMRESVPPEVHLATQPVAFHAPRRNRTSPRRRSSRWNWRR